MLLFKQSIYFEEEIGLIFRCYVTVYSRFHFHAFRWRRAADDFAFSLLSLLHYQHD